MSPTRLLAPALLAAALLVPSTAGAKELFAAKVCGAAGCTTSHDAATLRGLSEGGPSAPAPQSGAPFYTVRLTVKEDGASAGHWTVAWVPSTRLMRSRDSSGSTWLATTPAGDRAIARLTRDLKPFPAAKLQGVVAEAPAGDGVAHPRPAAVAPDDGGAFPWLIAALVAVAGAAAAGAALWRHRRLGGALSPGRGGSVARP